MKSFTAFGLKLVLGVFLGIMLLQPSLFLPLATVQAAPSNQNSNNNNNGNNGNNGEQGHNPNVPGSIDDCVPQIDPSSPIVITDDPDCHTPIAHLTVTKVVVNDDNGSRVVSDFPLFIGSTQVTSGVDTALLPGMYVVSETSNLQYKGSFSGDCDEDGHVLLHPGDSKHCTLTNDDIELPHEDECVPVTAENYQILLDTPCAEHVPSLTVVKVVVNDSGVGSKEVSDFPLFVNGSSVTSGDATSLPPGTYTVTETNNAQYAGSFSGDCDDDGVIVLNEGQHKTCTLTNNDIPLDPHEEIPCFDGETEDVQILEGEDCEDELPTLTVVKVVVNDSGTGSNEVSDFPLFVNGSSVTSGGTYSFESGSYTVTETSNATYQGSFSGDCNEEGVVTLSEGDHKTCTITNNDIADTHEGGGGEGGGNNNNNNNNGGGGIGGGGADGDVAVILAGLQQQAAPQGEVLGASICSDEYLTSYIKAGAKNDAGQVKKLQEFLNNHLQTNLPVTGFYGPLTLAAVNHLQTKYWQEILLPWVSHGLPNAQTPTGYVYKTTKRLINMLNCPDLNVPLPELP